MTMIRGTTPDQPEESGTVEDGDGTTRRFTTVSWRPGGNSDNGNDRDYGYGIAITIAFLGIIAVSAVTMYVSYEAQLLYTDLIKGEGQTAGAGETSLAVRLAAAAWDVAAASFAILALATAMRGDNALRARVGNLACAVASVLMNGARLEVPPDAGLLTWMGHILVWMGPSLLYVGATDTIVWEIQRRAMERRNKPLEQASIWSVVSVLLRAVLGVLLWILRLIFSPWKTVTLFRSWYLSEVAYAPGRTLEGDKARKAIEEASQAQGFAEEVERKSAAAIAEAEADYTRRANEAEQQAQEEAERVRSEETARADEAIRTERQRATEGIEAERARANTAIAEAEARTQELERKYEQDRGSLGSQYEQALQQLREEYEQKVASLESQATDYRQDQERVRAEMARLRSAAAQGEEHARELASVKSSLEEEQQGRQRAEQHVSALATEQQNLFDRLSGRAQVEYLYTRLGRHGDSRYGDPAASNEIAQEFVNRGVALTQAKVAHYIRTFVSESGPTVSSATTGSDASMGGAL